MENPAILIGNPLGSQLFLWCIFHFQVSLPDRENHLETQVVMIWTKLVVTRMGDAVVNHPNFCVGRIATATDVEFLGCLLLWTPGNLT